MILPKLVHQSMLCGDRIGLSAMLLHLHAWQDETVTIPPSHDGVEMIALPLPKIVQITVRYLLHVKS